MCPMVYSHMKTHRIGHPHATLQPVFDILSGEEDLKIHL